MSKAIHVLVVGNHSILRAALVTAVQMSGELLLAGEATTAAQALELCRAGRPEIVLLGSQLPDMNIPAATARICREIPGIKIVTIAHYEGANDFHESMKAGARGFVLRDRLTAELLPALRAVAAGQYYFPRELGLQSPPGSDVASAGN